jgi:non-ribosomal peptide synthetase component F
VGLLFERTPEALAALLAVLKAGGAYVPLDPGSPPEHRAAIGADAGLAALVGQAGLAPGIPNRPILDVDRADRNLDLESAEPLEGPSLPETAAYVIYTSGSTGGAKGVLLAHRGITPVGLGDWQSSSPRSRRFSAPAHGECSGSRIWVKRSNTSGAARRQPSRRPGKP